MVHVLLEKCYITPSMYGSIWIFKLLMKVIFTKLLSANIEHIGEYYIYYFYTYMSQRYISCRKINHVLQWTRCFWNEKHSISSCFLKKILGVDTSLQEMTQISSWVCHLRIEVWKKYIICIPRFDMIFTILKG